MHTGQKQVKKRPGQEKVKNLKIKQKFQFSPLKTTCQILSCKGCTEIHSLHQGVFWGREPASPLKNLSGVDIGIITVK